MTWTNGARFFSPDYGLKAGALADAIGKQGPLMVDRHRALWSYASGVWRPEEARGEVARRTVALLGERYRPAHLRAVRDVLAATLPELQNLPVTPYINFRNCMLAWETGERLDHHPEYLSTVQLQVDWNPDARCPEFEAFIERAVPEDDRARAWQLLGYLIMSGNPLQRLFMLIGTGGNGKGIYLNVIRALLGEENIATASLQDLADDKFASADLQGMMANVCGDIDASFIQNTARVKELSGDDIVRAQHKGLRAFKFKFWGKAIFSANAIPGSADSSRGWTRRWEVIRFPYEPTKPDPGLSAKVTSREELQGIAVRAVIALQALMTDGDFARGESAQKAHEEFREKANRVIRWMNDPDSNVTKEEGVWNKGTVLLKAFRQWEADDSGHGGNACGAQKFTELARQAGLRYAIRNGNRGFWGLRVSDTVLIPPRDQQWVNRGSDVHQTAPSPPPAPEQTTLDLG